MTSINDFWTKPNNTQLISLVERITVELPLPISPLFLSLENNNVSLTLIQGSLPRGLRINDDKLVGTPYEVVQDTEYKFVLRASQYGMVSDRTFTIVVTGPDDPVWVTPEGLLEIGSNKALYVLDNVPVDFQLLAYDPDTIAGDNLEFYIENDQGELPPGLRLTNDGRIVGIVEPILALEKAAASGNFDINNYGSFPYDFGIRPDNGYDTFAFDVPTYDLFFPTSPPKKLNRYYQFIVNISDGDTIVQRTFKIYVVGDDFLTADNTIMQSGTGIFTADVTNNRTPIWITPKNLGVKRANNFVTIFLDVIDVNEFTSYVNYTLQETNDDGSPSVLPPNLKLDQSNGELAGQIPYQPSITVIYKFTIRATRYGLNLEPVYKDKTFELKVLGELDSVLQWITPANLGTVDSNYISTLYLKASSTVENTYLFYTLESGSLPPGLKLNFNGEIIGKIINFGTPTNPGLTVFDNATTFLDNNDTTIDREYKFTVKVRDHYGFSAITREFTVKVTDPDKKLYSNIYFKPFLNEVKRKQLFDIMSDNRLFTSELIYRPNDPEFGVQKNLQMLLYAGIEAKESYYYVQALSKNHKRKKYKLGKIKTATAKEPKTNNVIYEVVYIEVIDPAEPTGKNKYTRTNFTNLNKDKRLVNEASINLENDSAEHQQPSGITFSTRNNGEVNNYFYPYFLVESRTGEQLNVSINPINIGLRNNTDAKIYNIIIGTPESYRFRPTPINTVKIDSDAISVDGDVKDKKYISNFTNMRKRIKQIGSTENNYLPLWMRTIQDGDIVPLGLINAIPLCYCIPGKSQQVVLNLLFYNINFNEFNYEIDRYIIDGIAGNSQQKYFVFHDYDYNI